MFLINTGNAKGHFFKFWDANLLQAQDVIFQIWKKPGEIKEYLTKKLGQKS